VAFAAGNASNPDSAAATAVADSFHAALAAGDTAAVMRLLAPDAVILESGDTESRAEYAAHHLAADMEFVQAVPGERRVTEFRIDGTVAWITATSTSRGEFRGRAVSSQGAELMVLSRAGGVWRIRAIHWSSRRR
jgi:uncharacterized protein (TIGR02246 family)